MRVATARDPAGTDADREPCARRWPVALRPLRSAMNAITKPTRTPGRRYEVYACSGRLKYGIGSATRRRSRGDRSTKRCGASSPRSRWTWRPPARRSWRRTTPSGPRSTPSTTRPPTRRQRAQDRLTRVRRDYQDGKLDADDWRSFRDELTGEHAAALAQVERLDEQRAVIVAEIEELDTENAVLEELTALRAMVVSQARDAEGLEAFRVALKRLFAGFELLMPFELGQQKSVPGTIGWPHELLSVEGVVLYPQVREDAIESLIGDGFPALRKAALALRGSDANTLVTTSSRRGRGSARA